MTDTRLASTISSGGAKVHTVEHLMSACAGLGLDNLYVDITADEVPDPRRLVRLVRVPAAKRRASSCRRRRAASSACCKPVEVREGEGDNLKWARLDPYHGFKLSFEIDFDHRVVDSTGQRVEFDLGTGSYARDIARARTFGFTKDVEMMRANGLALGGGLDNAIVMDDYRVLNTDGLRYDDEFVKHKILDAMGDLYIIGKPLLAAYSAFRSGHALNNKLLRELLSQQVGLRGRDLRRREARRPPASPQPRAPGRQAAACCCFAGPSCCCCWRPACPSPSMPAPGEARFKRFGLVDPQVDADRGVRLLRWCCSWSSWGKGCHPGLDPGSVGARLALAAIALRRCQRAMPDSSPG